jgi:hypothetical protein
VLVVGTAIATDIAASLEATSLLVPEASFDESWTQGAELEAWRDRSGSGGQYGVVVVVVDSSQVEPQIIEDVELDRWLESCETPFAQWFAALGVACLLCVDGGRVIAFVARPRPMDSGGWSLAACIADGVETMVRSYGFIANERNVRVDVVTLPLDDDAWIEGDLVRNRVVMLAASSIGSMVIHEGER